MVPGLRAMLFPVFVGVVIALGLELRIHLGGFSDVVSMFTDGASRFIATLTFPCGILVFYHASS